MIRLVEQVFIRRLACVAPLAELVLILRGGSFNVGRQLEALMAIVDLGLVQGDATTVRVRAVWPDLILRQTTLCFTKHRLHLATELRDSLDGFVLGMQIERRYAASQCFALFNCTEDYVLDPSTLHHLIIDQLLQFKYGVLQSLHVFRKHIVLYRVLYLLIYDYNPFGFLLILDFLGLLMSNFVGKLFTECTNTF